MTRLLTVPALFLAASSYLWGQTTEGPDVVVSASVRESDTGHLLRVSAKIREGLHIYAQSQPRPFLASRITVTDAPADVTVNGKFQADREPLRLRHPQLDVELHEFEGAVSWEVPLQIEGESDSVTIRGTVFAQACEDGRCYEPTTYAFEASIDGLEKSTSQASDSVVAVPPLPTDSTPPIDTQMLLVAEDEPKDSATLFMLDDFEVERVSDTQSAWLVLPLSFLAGFLLNFMPCVLPVVGLKLLSFVQQAQSNRRRILLMNLAYTAGLLSVMLVLASLAVFAGFGWGEQFANTGFTITLTAIVFAFGLSFLGVWEIPLPGFVSTADGKTPQEGYTGAFSKGILSTLLATPCSGPFLGAALAWAVTQPAFLTYVVFVTVGLGMASPYLLIGAFPSLIRLLPKPGNWMITFKYVMGFVMLGTVVYLLSFIAIASVIPTVLMLLGVGIAVWLAGRIPYSASSIERLRAWSIAAGVVSMTVLVSFGWLQDVMQHRFERAAIRFAAEHFDVDSTASVTGDEGIVWQDYSPERLESAIASGRPVFVDFTADWCLTCKANEASAVETEELSEALHRNQVIALRADKTNPNPEADELLRRLGNSAASIPFYAVFYPEKPSEPVLLDGVFTSPQPFVDAVERSVGKENMPIVAVR